MRSSFRRLLRWYFVVPTGLVAVGLAIPLAYLVYRGLGAESSRVFELVLSVRNARLLANTVLLAAGVLLAATLLSFPMAWLTARTDLRPRRLFAVVGVVPLAVPGYVMAYVILGLTGSYGMIARLIAVDVPSVSGYWGALIALSIYTSPYLFLNLRAAMLQLDPALEEAARSLGYNSRQVLLRVTLPQLRPAFLAGALLVTLHVMGDFGVVSLMRFETFSYAIYLQFAAAYDRTYAALLALMLLAMTVVVLYVEVRLLRDVPLFRGGAVSRWAHAGAPLGRWRAAAASYAVLFTVVALVIPVATILTWTFSGSAVELNRLARPLWNAVTASGPAAFSAALLAVPIAYMSVRLSSRLTKGIERLAYVGYAIPPLALALAYIFFSLSAAPALYQTLGLLVTAYTLHFLAEAIGPVRSALYLAPRHVEEAARSLGRTPLRAFTAATLPLLRTGIVVSIAFVFLSALKELPLTILLSPPGFETLSINVWSYTSEAMFGSAGPYALTLIVLSAAFVALLLRHETSPAVGIQSGAD